MSNIVTTEDCVAFDGYVAKWQQRLGLQDWRVERGTRRPKKLMAQVVFDDDARLVTYYIGQNFGAAEVTPDSLERTALHEMVHVLLHDLYLDWTDGNEHRVVNLMEKLLMESPR